MAKKLLIIICFEVSFFAYSMEDNFKKRKIPQEISIQKKGCFSNVINQLPMPLQSQIAFYCYINELKERNTSKKNFYFSKEKSCDILYKINKGIRFLSFLWPDRAVWQSPQKSELIEIMQTSNFFLQGWIKPETVKIFQQTNCELDLLVDESEVQDEQRIIIDYGNGQSEVIEEKNFPFLIESRLVLSSLSWDKNFLYTFEEKKELVENQSRFNIVVRQRMPAENKWAIVEKQELEDESESIQADDYIDMMYFEGFHCIGLLKKDEQKVKLVTLGEKPVDLSKTLLQKFFHKKGVCKHLLQE